MIYYYLPLLCKLRPVKAMHRENMYIYNFKNNYLYLKESNELQLIRFLGNCSNWFQIRVVLAIKLRNL